MAVVFSFLCSVAEAVLLSVDTPYLAALEQDNHKTAPILRKLKEDVSSPLAVILTLNTIAHTGGSVGVGWQVEVVFGDSYLAISAVLLTLVVLIFSEIIPKALGAHYWRSLAPATAIGLNFLIKILYPFVILSKQLTNWFDSKEAKPGFNRNEFTALAEIGEQEGGLDPQEASVLQNLFLLSEKDVRSVMTPHSVMFSLSAEATCKEFLDANENRFSRIPIYEEMDEYTGFVLRADIYKAYTQNKAYEPLKSYRRELPAILDKFSLLKALNEFVSEGHHIKLVVNEYGDAVGLLSLEDILEELIGSEIVDETDRVADMQYLARRLFRKRNKEA